MKLDKKKFSIIFLVIVLILFIIALIFTIWVPKGKGNIFSIGKDTTLADIVNIIGEAYNREVREMLLLSNSNKIFDKLDKTYIKENNLNADNAVEFLASNYLIGTNPIMLSYKYQKQGNAYIYRYAYRVNGFIKYVNLIETYPYRYTLSFKQDGPPTLKNIVVDQTVEGINFVVEEKNRTIDNISYELRIVNKTNNQVIFNFESINDFVINMEDGGELKLSSTVVGGIQDKINKNGFIRKNFMFGVSFTNQSQIKGMTFKNVLIDGVEKEIKIVF